MRLAVDLVSGIVGISTILGFMARRFRRGRELSHQEYQRKLMQENREIDEERKRLGLQ